MKTIGIIIRKFEENSKVFIGSRWDLFNTFNQINVNVIGIPINMNVDKLKEIISWCDGIVLSGGDNYLNQDIWLVKYLYAINKPTLGICLGMQTMGLAFDGEEINVNPSIHNKKDSYAHKITISNDSFLKNIIDVNSLLVNSRHISGIKNSKLDVGAISQDGVIEAIYDSSKKLFLGVQWHPESNLDFYNKAIIDYFINVL